MAIDGVPAILVKMVSWRLLSGVYSCSGPRSSSDGTKCRALALEKGEKTILPSVVVKHAVAILVHVSWMLLQGRNENGLSSVRWESDDGVGVRN